MTERKSLAVVRSYSELIAALRARRDELEVTHETIDDVSGVASGYTSKVLGPKTGSTHAKRPSQRNLGPVSLGLLLGALGLALVVVEDPAAMVRVRGRLVKRRYRPSHPRRRELSASAAHPT
jgi:hypothetical protein